MKTRETLYQFVRIIIKNTVTKYTQFLKHQLFFTVERTIHDCN